MSLKARSDIMMTFKVGGINAHWEDTLYLDIRVKVFFDIHSWNEYIDEPIIWAWWPLG